MTGWEVIAPFFFAAVGLSLLQFLGMVVALVDILRREDPDVVGDSRVIWVIIVILIPFAWVAYFLFGRR
jgi:hypothetical protein